MDTKIILTILGCLILVNTAAAQECAVNQCPNGLTCYDRNVPGELPYVCECNVPFSQGVDCSVQADNQEIFTCYGDSCQTGSFRSINYPQVYNNRYRALYLLYVPGAQSITFTFSDLFDIEEFKDELYVGAGLMYEDSQIDGVGSPPDWIFFEGSTKPDDFTIQGDVVWMYFGTDKNIQRSGFEISWTAAVDVTPPVFVNCPANIVANVEIGTPSTTVTWTVPTAVDASSVTTVSTHNPGQTFITGTTTTVVYTATDSFGNVGQCAFTVTVTAIDTTDPVVTVSSGTITREVEIGTPGANVFYTEPTATDNSGSATLFSRSAQPGEFFPVGQTVVTYIFQDASGNQGTGTFTVNVVEVDTTAPVITVPSATITRQVEIGSPGVNVFYTEPTATDNSGTANLVTRTAQPGDFFPVGQTTVTYTFQDPSGNPASATITINVVEVDTTPPVVTVPSGTITRQVEIGTPGVNVFYTEPTATDNSGTALLVTRSAQPGDFFPVGQTVVTYTFQDPAGNPATGTFTVNVVEVDTTSPVVNVPSPTITREVEIGTPGTTVFYTEPTATDNSGTVNLISRTAQPGDFFPVGQTVVTYTYQDPSGNPATATVTINVVEVDTTAPQVFVTSNEIFRTAPFGSSGINVFYTEPVAIDNSGTATLVSRSAQPGDFFPIGSTVVSYVYRDPAGNEATGTITVTVQEEADTIPPTITVSGGNIVRTVELGVTRLSVIYPEPTATDNSGTANLVSRTAQPGDLFPVGTTNVEYVFSDPAGNEARATFTVTVIAVDTTPPTVNCPGNVFEEVELGTSSATVFFTEPTAFDISGTANLVSRTAAPGDSFPVGTTSVTYVFNDNSGNEADPCTFTITVTAIDTTPPTVNCVTNVVQVVELGTNSAQVFYTEPTAFDISGQANLVTRTSAPGDTFPVGTTSVTYVFADNAGNQADPCTFTITVNTEDTTPPTVNCINDVTRTVELGTASVVVFYTEPTASDISGQTSLVTRTSAPGDSFPVGTTVVSYVFADGSGNQAQPCTFNVIVNAVDTTPPTVNCVSNIAQTVELGQTSAVVNYVEPTATDISGTAFLVSRTSAPGDTFPVGTTTVSYIFSDQSGNEAAPCVFTITIGTVDTMTPMFTSCPSNIVQSVELGTPGTVISWTTPTANDAAGIASIIGSIQPGSFFVTGETATVTYVATDNSGLTDNSCSFTVTIFSIDTTPPTVACTANIFRTVELGTNSVQVFYTEPTASDLSGQANLVSRTHTPGDSFPVGTTTVTYVFADNSGNTADDCSFTITVTAQDTTPPTVNCVSDITRTVELGITSAQVFYSEPTATDLGQASLISRTNQPGDNFPVGVTSVTYVFGDNSGNVADPCTFTITVTTVDTTPPTVNCVNDITRVVELGTTSVAISYTEPTATDLSGTATLVSRSHMPGQNFPLGTTVVSYFFSDASGNNAPVCQFTVTVNNQDTTPPVVTDCPANIVQSVELGTPGTTVTFNPPTATDIAGIASIVSNIQSGTFFTAGETRSVTFTVTDNSGLTDTSCTFTITIFSVDTTPPTITVPSDTITREVELGTPGLNVFYPEPTASDISGTTNLVSRTAQPGDFFPVGQTVVTYTFQDPSGNPASGTFTVNVVEVDTTPPVINVPSDTITREVELGTPGLNVFYTEPTATDISGTANLVSRTAQPGDFFPVGQTVVIYTFQDPSGNPASGTFTVNVVEVDTTPPVITVPSDVITREVELGTPGLNVFYTEPTASDISGTAVLVTRTSQPGDFFPVGQTVVTYTYQDPSGNPASGTFTVNVVEVDTTPPAITVPSDVITREVELGTPGLNVFYTEPTATDISGTAVLVSRTAQPGDFFPVGQTVVMYTYQDPSGNPATGTFTVNVVEVDTTPPVITVPSDTITREVELGTPGLNVIYTEPTATDISGTAVLVTRTAQPGDFFPVGQTVVMYTYQDPSGNLATGTFTVNVVEVDTTPPVISILSDIITREVELGTPGLSVFYPEPTASDISGTANLVSRTFQPGDFFPVGQTTVTYTFQDPSGNPATGTFTVNVVEVDTTPPVVTVPSSTITRQVELGTSGTNVIFPEPTATDISGTTTLVSRTAQPGDFFPVGQTVVTYTYEDPSGNRATGTVTVNIVEEDTTPPTVQNCPADIIRTIEINSASEVPITWSPPTATDISGTQFIRSQTGNVGQSFPVGTTVVTYIFSDASGNDADPCSFNVIILTEDTTPPVILNCPSDITETTPLNSGGTVITFIAPSAVDNSNQEPSVTATNQPNTFYQTGETVVTYTFTDQAGNPSSCSFTITVIEVDTENPVIQNCPSDINVNTPLGTALTVVTWPALTVTDNSGQTSIQSQSAASGDSFPPGRTTVTIIYQDPSSNTDICQFTVIVTEVDGTPPEILSCPSDITINVPVESSGTTVTWTTPVVTDNSGLAPTVTSTSIPGSFFLRGSTTVTYTFTDNSGNQVSCSFVVTVTAVDEVNPIVTCPENVVETVLEGVDNAYVTFDLPIVTDNNGATNLVSSTANSGDPFPVGTTVVTFTYADNNGNEASCSFSVTVLTDTPCAPNPCFNGGACVVNSLTEYQCVCSECYTGTNCETQLNACDANLCQNGAACVAYEGSCDSYYCECPACFVGIYCDVPVDSCDNHQCQNGGACVLDDNTCLTYTCSCPLCYTGEFCQTKVDACDNHQCQNGAACEPVGELCTEYTCQCSGCFTGDLCDEVRDPCDPSPCLNNAQCNVLGDSCFSYSCECVGCFTGFNCEDPIPSPCENNPCQNGGVCSVIPGVCSGYQCTCPDGFTGVNCEEVTIVNTNPCNNFPCDNGGTCVNVDSNDYSCLCTNGYTGINCQTPTQNAPNQDSCTSAPCLNGATCVNSYDSSSGANFYLNQYTCICESGFTGTNCGSTTAAQPLLDVCTNGNDQSCQNGGVCYNMYQSLSQGVDFYCECPIGWTGHTCETPSVNPCASAPCENGGICTPFNTYFECDCPEGFFGTTCEVAQGDTEPPVISNCPDDITQTISSGTGITVSWLEPTATDAGTTQRLLRSHVPGSFFPVGDTAVTYVFTDNSENLARCTFFVTVTLAETDNTPPVIQNCPSTTVAQATAGSTTAQVTWVEPTATDDSGTAVRVSNNYSPGQVFPVGSTIVLYTFTDDAGNQNTCTFTVRVVVEVVNQSPTITFCPAGPLVYSTQGADEVIVNFPAPTAVDDSGLSPTVSSNYQPGQSFAVGSYAVTYTFTDNVGLTSDCSFNIEVVAGGDVRPPTISNCPAGAINALAPAGTSGTSVSWTVPTATDESGSVSSTSNYSPGAVFPIGTTTVTYTFTDLAGNEARCIFNVIVTGTSVTETPAPSNLVLTPGTTTLTASWTPPNGAFNSYSITISGASTVNTQTLPQSSSSYTATGLNPATTYVVTLVANGNTGASDPVSASATTNPEQGQAPSAPSNLRFVPTENSILVSFDAASGDVTGYTIGLGTTSNANDVTDTLAPGATSYTFTNLAPSTVYFISLQAFNNFGSSPSVVESATTSDVVTPGTDIVITNCPVAVSAALPFGTFAFVDWEDPVATSSLGAVTQTGGPPNSNGYFQIGSYPIVYEFEDVNGNTATCSFSIYVSDGSDTTPPEITFCPSNVFVQAASGASSATASWNVPTATDASEPITAVSNYSPGDSFDIGTYLVVYNLIDAAGLFSTCSFEVTVTSSGVITDRENPVLTGCPTDIVSNANPGASTMVVTWNTPVASDNSGSATLTVNLPPGSSFPIGSTEVTYTATDPSGNSVSCSFDVIVLSTTDNIPPVLSNCPTDQTLFASSNVQGVAATWSAPTASDNSGDVPTLTSNFNSGDVFPVGVTTVTITATDSSGNFDTCSFTITVIGATDNVGPVTSNCPASQSITAGIGATSAVATWTEPIFTDSSGVASVTNNFNPGSSFPIGTTVVTYTATDFLGNVGNCSFSVTVSAGTDSTRPTFINCPTNIETTVPFGTSGTTVTWTEPIAVDNSPIVSTVATQNPGSFFIVGTTTVVYTATDTSGNVGTCSFQVTVTEEAPVDVTPPELFNCPTGITATANPGSSFAIVTWTPPTATDNVGVPVVTSNFPSGSSFPVGTTLVTYTAVDNNGNDASCSFNVVVSSGTSNAAPVITFCPNDGQIYFTAPSASSVNVNFAPPTATDDSGSVTTSSTNEPGDEFALGMHSVTYTFSDAQGLTATCTFSFEVQVGANPCSSNPCAPTEQCFYIPSQYLCINNGRRRREAEMLDLSDVCPCENGGICLLDDATSSATCECPVGYAGVLCEIDTMPAANVNVHNRYSTNHDIQAWSDGNSALLWSVIICMAIMLVVIISLSAVLCYVVPRLGMVRQHRSKIDEIPILQ